MRISLILGAGASVANAETFRPKQKTSYPPLDYSFFAAVRRLNVTVPSDLTRYAAGLPSGSPFAATDREARMEQFFREVFYNFLDSGDSDVLVRTAYLQLIDLYTRMIRLTTNWMLPDGHIGGIVGKLIAAAADVADEVNILTFNHDLVIENEIFKRARLKQRWCIGRAYGAFSNNRRLVNGPDMFPPHSPQCNHDRPIVIHKLHGSLNWKVKMRGREPTHAVLTGNSTSPTEIEVYRRRDIPAENRVSVPSSAGRRNWYAWPVIVPPIYEKQALIRTFLSSVWSEARDALSSSDRIVIFGYSMPLADVEAELVIQRAIARNADLPWLGVIDPDPKTALRFMDALPQVTLRRFPNARAFLDGPGNAPAWS